jgi:hypothetical protein
MTNTLTMHLGTTYISSGTFVTRYVIRHYRLVAHRTLALQTYFGVGVPSDGSDIIRPQESQIPDNVWQLIQQCCEDDPNSRATINMVVEKMESWRRSTCSPKK